MTLAPIAVGRLSADRVAELVPLLQGNPYAPLRFLAKELGGSLVDHWSEILRELLQTEGVHGYHATVGGAIVGIVVCSDSPWETRILGANSAAISHLVVAPSVEGRGAIARRLLDAALDDARSRGVLFVSTKTYTDDLAAIHALESRGFLLMDTVVDCYFDYRRTPLGAVPAPATPADVIVRSATPDDRAELVSVARLAFSGHFGRFHADERIGRANANRIYEEWIHSSLDGYADAFIVAEIGGRIAGFSIWRRPGRAESTLPVRVGHYSISGIHPDHHGRGLFTALTLEGMKRMEGVADVLEGPTHVNNYGVQVGYAKLQWRVCGDAKHSFHKWFGESPE